MTVCFPLHLRLSWQISFTHGQGYSLRKHLLLFRPDWSVLACEQAPLSNGASEASRARAEQGAGAGGRDEGSPSSASLPDFFFSAFALFPTFGPNPHLGAWSQARSVHICFTRSSGYDLVLLIKFIVEPYVFVL